MGHIEGFNPEAPAYDVFCIAKNPSEISPGVIRYGFATTEEPPRAAYVAYEPRRGREGAVVHAVGTMSVDSLETAWLPEDSEGDNEPVSSLEIYLDRQLSNPDPMAHTVARLLFETNSPIGGNL